MSNYCCKKALVIGIILLFVGISGIPLISGITVPEGYDNLQLTQFSPILEDNILFFDDFDDNEKNFAKWTEIYTDGVWTESNQRCEFMVWEPGYGGRNKEGIQSTEFIAPFSADKPLVVTWDIITDIFSTNWAGKVFLEITDGTNWIWARFHRFQLATHFMDSNDATYTYLSTYKPDSSWSNEIQVFSDRYIVKMAGDSSGEIYDTIFTPDSPLRVCIYIICAGEKPWLFQRSGFDNVKVTIDKQKSNRETKVDLIEGCIKKSLVDENEYITYTGPLYIENIVRLALKKIMSLFN